MSLYVDSREPPSIRRKALELGFVQVAKDVGDYSCDKCVIERKTIQDFVNSIYARYGEHGRIWDQAERLYKYCKSNGAIGVIIIHGNLKDVEKEFKERGQTLGKTAIFGAIASLLVRYDLNILWVELPIDDVLYLIKSILEKINEGKMLLPERKRLKEYAFNRNVAVLMKTFELSFGQASRLEKKFKTLYGVVEAARNHPSEIYTIEGIGPRTLRKIQEYAGII